MLFYPAIPIREAMGRSDPGPKKYKDQRRSEDDKIKDRYKTELIFRPKNKDIIRQAYNTSPADKFSQNKQPDKKKEATQADDSSQFQYIKNNLCVKTCICNGGEVLRFQVKKVTIRNYTPKILNQEINMGMWM